MSFLKQSLDNIKVWIKLENGLPTARGIGIDSIISSSNRYQGEINYKIQEGICTACVILNP